jgi:predicted O-methyltransferase YrrM
MGLAFDRNGGHLYTLDIDPEMVRKAKVHIKNVGLEKTVTVIEGDALKALPTMEGEFDFLFLDAVKSDYMAYFKAMESKLKPGSVIVADNVVRFGDQMKDYLDYMHTSPDYDTVIIRASEEKGDGMAISYKLR